MHVLDARDTPRRCGRLQVLRETGYGAVQRHLPVYVLHRDIRHVDERVIAEFPLHGVADVLRFGHFPDPFDGLTVNCRSSFISSSHWLAVVKVRMTVTALVAAMAAEK